MDVSDYLRTTYRRGGRGPKEFDCWGLVRDAHHRLFGRDIMPSFSEAEPESVKRRQGAIHALHESLQTFDVPMREGAIAEAWVGSLFLHVGIVVRVNGRLFILETDTPNGPTLTKPSVFASRYSKVRFFDTIQ